MGLARCALTPQTMQSKKYYIKPAAKVKNVAVVGGGIGCMEIAILCAKRGHNVTLYEKTDRLGGVFIAAAAPSFKEKDRDLIKWYIRQIEKHPITVKMNTEITDVKQLDADEIIIATGAKAKKIPVKGADSAVEAVEYLIGEKEVGENAVIIGGGLTGCEIAYDLYLKGKNPTIVEMQDDLITTKGICLANTSFLRDFFKTNKVPVHLQTSLCEIVSDGIIVKDKEGNQFKIEADSVIMSVGYNPSPIAAKGRHIHIIGDADKVGNLRSVIWGAWKVGMKI
jgi:2-enoate reductase